MPHRIKHGLHDALAENMSHFIGREQQPQPKSEDDKDAGLRELEELREFAYHPQNLRYLDNDLLHMLCLTIYTPLVGPVLVT